MGTPTKVALAAGAVVLATAAVVMSTRSNVPGPSPATVAARADEERAGEREREREPASIVAAPSADTERAAVRPSAEDAPASAQAQQAPPAAELVALVEARVVDARGVGIPSAWLEGPDDARAMSDGSGFVELRVPLEIEHSFVELVYGAPGYARGIVEATLDAGRTARLGELVAQLGATIAGVVLDEIGGAVAGASVWADATEPTDETPEELRRRGRRWFRSGSDSALAVRTDASGIFVLEGVALDPVRVWATKQGHVHAWTEPIVLQPGERRLGIELRLPELGPEDSFSGVVLDPFGEPLANAAIDYSFEAGDFGMSGGVFADQNGRFSMLLWRDVEHDLVARDREDRYGVAFAHGVRGGMHDVEMQLTELRELELVVRDGDGEPVDGYRCRVVTHTRSLGGTRQHVTYPELDERPGDVAIVRVPEARFSLDVDAPGYAARTLGPYDPESAPRRVECVLEPGAGISGRVTAAGAPVPGASVRLYRVGEDLVLECDGFPSAVECSYVTFAHTDSEGAYTLVPEEDGVYRVRVEAEGHAPAESDDFVVAGPSRIDGIDLVLDEGGTLVVQVRGADGTAAVGTVVAISRGDANELVARAGDDGRAVFERIVPGRWNVESLAAEPDPSHSESTAYSLPSGEERPELPWVVVVPAGGTATYDLDVGER